MLLAWLIALQLSDIMVARLIRLLGWTGKGAIDTTMQNDAVRESVFNGESIDSHAPYFTTPDESDG
ncbi:hypothetical protein QUB08_06565 [Microcoleus sp. BR0-C5]|uniref:hypothetical protein n=1 Tax=Microcoleus sp. BR0-C5 TaxID=2818713 RepID=UPI002FD73308